MKIAQQYFQVNIDVVVIFGAGVVVVVGGAAVVSVVTVDVYIGL